MSFNTKLKHNKSIFKQVLSWYSTKLQTHPLTTKAITSGIIAGAGDLTCQLIVQHRHHSDLLQVLRIEKKHNVNIIVGSDERNTASTAATSQISSSFVFEPDVIRTSRFAFLGFALIAPVVHVWYGFLMKKIPGTSLKRVLQRTFLDQACFSPIFVPTFMTSLMILEQTKPFDEIVHIVKRDVGEIIISNWTLWIPAMLFNFKFVPGKWQVLFSNGIGFIWNVYLSWKIQEG